MRKQTPKTNQHDQEARRPRILSSSDLQQVTGGRHDAMMSIIQKIG